MWRSQSGLRSMRRFNRIRKQGSRACGVMGFLLCLGGLVQPVAANPDARQITLFQNNCVQCHVNPDTGAPMAGVAQDWTEAVARGEDAMLRNVVEGRGGMPPLGYCSACSEADLRVLIRLLTGAEPATGEQP